MSGATINAEQLPQRATEASPNSAPTPSGTLEEGIPIAPAASSKVVQHPPDDPGDKRGAPAYRGPQQIHAGMRS